MPNGTKSCKEVKKGVLAKQVIIFLSSFCRNYEDIPKGVHRTNRLEIELDEQSLVKSEGKISSGNTHYEKVTLIWKYLNSMWFPRWSIIEGSRTCAWTKF